MVKEKIKSLNKFGIFSPALALAIGLYYHLAVFFFTKTNIHAQKVLPDAFDFTQFVFRPEPFEQLGYFIGYFVIPIFALAIVYLINFLVSKEYLTESFVKKWPYALGLGALSILAYKIFLHIFWFEIWRQIPAKGDLKLQALSFVSLSLALVLYWRRFDLAIFIRWFQGLPWGWLRYVFFALLIFLIFNPNFVFDFYHYNFFLGPINDLLHGKILLIETTTHYGVLSTYFLFGIFKVIPISYQGLSMILAITFIVWHIAWYYLIKKWLHSEAIAVLAVLAMLIFLNVMQIDFDLIYLAPSNTPFHQLSFLLVAFFFYKLATSQPDRMKRYENYILFTTALGFYWFVDNGIYLLFATLGVFLFREFFQENKFIQKIRSFGWTFVKQLSWIFVIGGFYSLGQYLRTGFFPDWGALYKIPLIFNKGYMMIPLPSYGYYYVYIFIFLASLIYIFWQSYSKEALNKFLLPMFITLYGILQLVYYISRSHPLNLAPRESFLLILLIAWGYQIVVKKYKDTECIYYSFSGVLAGVLMFMTMFGGYRFLYTIQQRDYADVGGNYVAETIGQPNVYGGNDQILGDIDLLRQDYSDIERPAIIHWFDTEILLSLDKTNYYGSFSSEAFNFANIFFKSGMDQFIEKTRQERPEYLFVGRKESDSFGPFSLYEDKLDYFQEGVDDLYIVDRQLETINVLKLVTQN